MPQITELIMNRQYSALGRSNITVNSNTNRTEVDKTSELYVTVAECKRMARAIKSSRIIQPSIIQEVQAYLPTRDVCDQLLECYFRTFEGIFRVFHIPTFMKEYESYWVNPAMIKSSILLKVLLVCALGVTFYSGPEKPRLRADCAKWLQAAESWLSGPHAKSRFNIAGTQIQILVLLARQICSIDGDLVWVPAGRLLRGAMHLGLHRDPNHIGEMSVFHAEMRRRLWATVMEITVQSSLDFGMPPMISPDDYSTLPPSNFNDEDIYEAERSTLEPKPFTQFTQSSIQIALYETLPLRLEITRLINNLHRSLTYDETLALGNQILARCREKTAFMQSFLSSSRDHAPNVFQIKLFDTLIRRFYLCLHRPYFTLAEQDPRYYYSRKVCLDTSLIIITPTEVPAETEDDWTCLTHRAVGFVKHFFLFSSSTIYLELISQLDPDRDTALPAPLTSAMIPAHRSLSPELQSYYDALQYARSGAEARIRKGEVNAKGYIWLCAALARVDALISRTDADAAVLVAARKAVGHAAGLMKEAYFAEHGEYIDLSQHNPTGGKSYVHGEGADDLTSTPELLNDQLNHAGAGNSAVECGDLGGLDWGRFLQDDGLDLEWGIGVSPDPWLGSGLDCWST